MNDKINVPKNCSRKNLQLSIVKKETAGWDVFLQNNVSVFFLIALSVMQIYGR